MPWSGIFQRHRYFSASGCIRRHCPAPWKATDSCGFSAPHRNRQSIGFHGHSGTETSRNYSTGQDCSASVSEFVENFLQPARSHTLPYTPVFVFCLFLCFLFFFVAFVF